MTICRPIFKSLRPLLVLLPLTCAAQFTQAPAPAPEPAYVTIYSRPLSLNSFVPGTKNGMYTGRIFEGDHLLAHIRPSHFVTFAVTPGSHTFAANSLTSKSSSGGGELKLDLQPGQHTFVQASMTISGNVMAMAFILKEIPCNEAQSINKTSKPIAAKDVLPEGAKLVLTDTTFPACPASVPQNAPPPAKP